MTDARRVGSRSAQRALSEESDAAARNERRERALQGPGNAWLLERLGDVQPKLVIGEVDDPFEREADRIAEALAGGGSAPQRTQGRDTAPVLRRQAEPAGQTSAIDEEERRRREELARAQIEKAEDVAERPEELEPVEEEQEEEKKEEEEEPVQTKRAGGSPSVTPELESALAVSSGGRPLAADTRGEFERGLGHDLSGVRVHTDDRAASLAGGIGARAFTRGRDVYFAGGQYQPGTREGRRLLAHELAHTVQQSPGPRVGGGLPVTAVAAPGSVQRDVLQRDNGDAAASEVSAEEAVDPSTLPLETGRLDPDTETVTFAELPIPSFKRADHRGRLYGERSPLRRMKSYQRGSPAQRTVWSQALAGETQQIQDSLTEKVRTAERAETLEPGRTYYFKGLSKFGQDRYFIGDLPTVARELLLPSWDRSGQGHSYDVDHIVELQVANWGADSWANTIDNMELLDSNLNRSSGSSVKTEIEGKANAFITASGGAFGTSVAQIKSRYHMAFNTTADGGGGSASPDDFWTPSQVTEAEHMSGVRVASPAELGGDGEVKVFPGEAGGVAKSFTWPGDRIPSAERSWLKPYVITSKQFNTEEGSEAEPALGALTFNIPEDHPQWRQLEGGDATITVSRFPEARFAGYIDRAVVRQQLRRLRHKEASPITFEEFEITEEGISLGGQILPELDLLENVQIDFGMTGDGLEAAAELVGDDLAVPAPFQVREAALRIAASTAEGFSVTGRADFEIERLGEGFLAAGSSTSEPFFLEGEFSFDTRLFDPAEVDMEYRDGNLGLSGRLGITSEKMPGIESAQIEASYSSETGRIEATGNVRPQIEGIQEGELSLVYSPETGFEIGGRLDLSPDIPAIQSGSVEVTIRENREEERYEISARGEATADVAGADVGLTIDYDDGALTIEGSGAYERGLLSGRITVGATNRALDEAGAPTGEATDELVAYGGGEMDLRLAPWLEATIGVRLLPNGEIEVSGGVGLPAALELFPEQAYERNIFTIGIDIPIVGVAVAGQRIGIFATIQGGLDLSAGVGPGELRELGLTVTYNPDREQETTISGGARLVIPAHAGLRLFVRGGIGAGIPIVSATAALEIGGELGLEGALEAGVEVEWSPARGLVLDAEGEIWVQPKFTFDITGMVLVEADLVLTTIELYSKRWDLAQFEFGSDLRFGIRLPIHYEEGQPFEVSWDDVEFEVPEVDPEQILSGLLERI